MVLIYGGCLRCILELGNLALGGVKFIVIIQSQNDLGTIVLQL